VRFASVYKQFKTLDELVTEAKAVLDAKRYEVPGQGRLFIDPSPATAAPANGAPTGNGEHAGEPVRKPRRGKKADPAVATPAAAPDAE
jgi:hypothetical protein